MKTLINMAMATLCFAMGTAVAATPSSDFKVAVVNMQRIVEQAPEIAKARKSLKSKFKPRADALMELGKKLEKEGKDFSRNRSVMSKAELEKQQAALTQERRDFFRQQQDLQADLGQAQRKVMKDFTKRVNKAVASVAAKHHEDLILQKHTVIFASKKMDITDDVLKALS